MVHIYIYIYIYITTHLKIWQRMEGQRAVDHQEIAELLPGEAGGSRGKGGGREGEGRGKGEGREREGKGGCNGGKEGERREKVRKQNKIKYKRGGGRER